MGDAFKLTREGTPEQAVHTTDCASAYLDLLKLVLTRSFVDEEFVPLQPTHGLKRAAFSLIRPIIERAGVEFVRRRKLDHDVRSAGHDWPSDAETMIGVERLDNLDTLIRDVIENDVPGDILEAGVWRGGAGIFGRAALKAYGDRQRRIWLADSFQGLPKPSRPEDEGDTHWTFDELAVPVEEVRRNFERYGLLDDRVRFLPGWFSDTLTTPEIEELAILRLDGDMYGSTMDALTALYEKVAVRGYVIVDDYDAVPACRAAVEHFRRDRAITAPLVRVDWSCVYWQKPPPRSRTISTDGGGTRTG